jgi:hypothetical protein
MISLLAPSCRKDPSFDAAILHVHLNATMNGAPFALNQPFKGPEGLRMTVEDFRFYLSDITLNDSSGQQATTEIALLDFTEDQTVFSMRIAPGQYQNLRFAVGVPPALNGIGINGFNPAAYPAGHPLNVQNGMYWTSNTGYVFLIMQGKLDTSSAQNKPLLFPWFYHVGLNEMYAHRSLDLDLKVKPGDDLDLYLTLELNDIFVSDKDTISIRKESFTHTTDNIELAARVIKNFRNAIRLR